jgi:predicted kinase
VIIVMAGLPGTGKTSLAKALAERLGGVVVSKDEIRAAAFGKLVDYSSEQDDFCMELVYQIANYIHGVPVIIDGRTFSKGKQIERMREVLGEVKVIECVAEDRVVKERLARDRDHVAKNRTYEMYLEVKRAKEELQIPRLTIDTEMKEAVELALEYVSNPTSSPPERGAPSPRPD